MHGDKERRRGPTSEGPVESCPAGLFTSMKNVDLSFCEVVVHFLLQESLEELAVAKRWYGNRDDFTVVIQDAPLISDPSLASVS